ncbi:hypothetical protein ACJIZ3_022273 [Penstemon smallii]|uniref:Uncharacterized protein n=1 Tax=Penstemon smallii TaxID=265156 RepID=A0ABD3TMW1_9LAMI
MATPAHRLIQDQNLNILYNDVAKPSKKGGLGGRKALNDISNSRKPSVLQSTKKDNSTGVISIEKDPFAFVGKGKVPDKGKTGGRRKALGDLTNSVKPSSQQVVSKKKLDPIVEERFLHNHQECIKAHTKAVDMDYFLKSVGLNNENPVRVSSTKAFQSSSKKPATRLEMEEMPTELAGYCSPASRSPKSPHMNWDDDRVFADLIAIETPKLRNHY